MSQPTLQEVLKTQGTRLQDLPPWMTYNASFEEKLDPKLEEEVKRYSEKRHEKSSTQNEEELCRQKELSQETAKQYQWIHPSEYADEGPRIGKIIHSSEFINRLRKNEKVQFWYRDHPQPGKVTLLWSKGFLPEVACWAQLGFMPEYSIMRFDEHGIPTTEKYRGWRTCLLQMIIKQIISEDWANRAFGYAQGPASDRYLHTLYDVRNTMTQ